MITGPAGRRRWSTEQKLRIIEESYEPGTSVSEVARRHGVAANLEELGRGVDVGEEPVVDLAPARARAPLEGSRYGLIIGRA